MTTHTFDSTGDAYDATQTNDAINDGDVLLIPAERIYAKDDNEGANPRIVSVVGLAWTWPVAVTAEFGHLHTITSGVEHVMAEAGWTDAQVREACALAGSLGLPLHPAFQAYLNDFTAEDAERIAACAAEIEGNAIPMAVVDYAGRVTATGIVAPTDTAHRFGTRDMRHVEIYALKVVRTNPAARAKQAARRARRDLAEEFPDGGMTDAQDRAEQAR